MFRRIVDRAFVAVMNALPEFHFTNHTKIDKKGEFPLAGQVRATSKNGRRSVRLAWDLWTHFAHVGAKVDPSEGEAVLFAALPPVALWFGVEDYRALRRVMNSNEGREIRISAHDGSVRWSLWTNPDIWSSKTPRWRQGTFSMIDFLLGRRKVETEVVSGPEDVTIPMPEGNYLGRSTIERVTWSRPRWFSDRWMSASVTMDPRVDPRFKPIPIPGKGENSYDLGEDALYSMSTRAGTHADAVTEVVKSVLCMRERRAGLGWRPEKTPDATPTAMPN